MFPPDVGYNPDAIVSALPPKKYWAGGGAAGLFHRTREVATPFHAGVGSLGNAWHSEELLKMGYEVILVAIISIT